MANVGQAGWGPLSPVELSQAFAAIDKDNSGEIEFGEFRAWWELVAGEDGGEGAGGQGPLRKRGASPVTAASRASGRGTPSPSAGRTSPTATRAKKGKKKGKKKRGSPPKGPRASPSPVCQAFPSFAVHSDRDFPMPHLSLSRNIEDGNATPAQNSRGSSRGSSSGGSSRGGSPSEAAGGQQLSRLTALLTERCHPAS
jgi:hypothetical protein